MEKKYICAMLPKHPPAGLIEFTKKSYPEDLGLNFLIVNCERWPDYGIYGRLPQRWKAVCTCTNCNEVFVTEKIPGIDAIRIAEGPDSQIYPCTGAVPQEEYEDGLYGEWTTVEVAENDQVICPHCGQLDVVIFGRKIRGGRTKRLQIASYCEAGKYGGICYWLVEHQIGQYGSEGVSATPRDAYLLTEHGGLVRFSHRDQSIFGTDKNSGCWRPLKACTDVWDKSFFDWRSINNLKAGGAIFANEIDTAGSTAEKTGLMEFMKADGWPPVLYLKLWRQARGVENLVKSGQVELIKDIVKEAYRYSADVRCEAKKYLNISRRKPSEMLGISKAEFKELTRRGIKLRAERLQQWHSFRELNPSFLAYLDAVEQYGGALEGLIRLAKEYDQKIEKIVRYLEKQHLQPEDARLLIDTRWAYARLAGDRPLAYGELWPRNLQKAHDAATEQIAAMEREEKAKEYQKGFDAIRQKYKGLEWTDGDLCIKLPESLADLQREGDVLQHCVGSYGKQHISQSDVIFFVRHYRRPERPFYTLDINMKGRPSEVQLHGYGNEAHGDKKQYRHRLDPKVRAFCDRWKAEVLMPFYVKNKNKEMIA